MRYDTPVYFQTIKSEYDSATGNTGISILTEERRNASVTDSGTDTLTLVYGGIKQGSKTIRLQRPYEKPFDRIRIGEKLYQVDFSRKDRNFVVSGVT
jgi:hypothetical protein